MTHLAKSNVFFTTSCSSDGNTPRARESLANKKERPLSLIFSIIFYVLHALLAVTSYFIVCVYSLRKIADAYMFLYKRAPRRKMLPLFLRERRRDSLIILIPTHQTLDSENLTPLWESCRSPLNNGMSKFLITHKTLLSGDFYEIYALNCHVKGFRGDADLPCGSFV